MNRPTRIAHTVSVVLMGVGVLVATADGFAQSYAGLHKWATEQGLKGWKADTFPLLVDLFILVGEIGLFALALEGHRLTRKGLSWLDMALPFGLAVAGWGVSLAFNVGAVHGWEQQVTAAVAPIASMLGLLVLLRTVHRLIARTPQAPAEVPARPVDAPQMNGATVTATVDEPPVPATQVPEPVTVPALTEPVPASVPDASPSAVPDASSSDGSDASGEHVPARRVPRTRHGGDPAEVRAVSVFAADIAAGQVPSIRRIKATLRCGQTKASQVRAYLASLDSAPHLATATHTPVTGPADKEVLS